MTTEPATGEPTKKRVRFDETPEPVATTPSSAARDFLSSSLLSLPKSIRTIAQRHGTKFNKLLSQIQQRTLTKVTFASDDFIPRSAKLQFSLTASPKVMESPEFKTLADETVNLLATFQKELKNKISSTVDLEIKDLKNEVDRNLCIAVHDLAVVCLVNNNPKDLQPPARKLTLLILEKQHSTLLQHTSMTVNTVFVKYKEFLEDPSEVYTFGSISEAEKAALAVPLVDLTKLCNILFVEGWNKRMAVFHERQKELALQKAATLILLDKPTSEAAMILDTEQTVDMKTLGELIDRKVAEKTKSLTTTIGRLQQETRRQPKGQREAQQASTKKKSSKAQLPKKKNERTSPTKDTKEKEKEKKKKQKQRQNAADGNDSDSSAGQKQKSTKKKSTKERNTNKRSSKSGRR
jgi:hypothetical protein